MIDATIGGGNANSFCTLAEADIYHAGRLHNDPWVSAKPIDKERALIWACRILSGLKFKGNVATDVQKLPWPRVNVIDELGRFVNSGAIPERMKEAQAEFAFHLIETDRLKKQGPEGLKRVKVATLEIEADPTTEQGSVPGAVREMLRPFLSAGFSSSSAVLVRT